MSCALPELLQTQSSTGLTLGPPHKRLTHPGSPSGVSGGTEAPSLGLAAEVHRWPGGDDTSPPQAPSPQHRPDQAGERSEQTRGQAGVPLAGSLRSARSLDGLRFQSGFPTSRTRETAVRGTARTGQASCSEPRTVPGVTAVPGCWLELRDRPARQGTVRLSRTARSKALRTPGRPGQPYLRSRRLGEILPAGRDAAQPGAATHQPRYLVPQSRGHLGGLKSSKGVCIFLAAPTRLTTRRTPCDNAHRATR